MYNPNLFPLRHDNSKQTSSAQPRALQQAMTRRIVPDDASTWKEAVDVATISPIMPIRYIPDVVNSHGLIVGSFYLAIEDIHLKAGYRVLVKNQANKKQNGLYVVVHNNSSGFKLQRIHSQSGVMMCGLTVLVKFGLENREHIFSLRGSANGIDDSFLTVNIDDIVWITANTTASTQQVELTSYDNELIINKTESGNIINFDLRIVDRVFVRPEWSIPIDSAIENTNNTFVVDPNKSFYMVDKNTTIASTTNAVPIPLEVGQIRIFSNKGNGDENTDGEFIVDFGTNAGVITAGNTRQRYMSLGRGACVAVFWNGDDWQLFNTGAADFYNDPMI